MKDPNKYGIYWVAKENGKPIDHGLVCIAEDKYYAEHIKYALDNMNINENIEYLIAVDYPF